MDIFSEMVINDTKKFLFDFLKNNINKNLSVKENNDFLFLCVQLLGNESVYDISDKIEIVIKKSLTNIQKHPEEYLSFLPLRLFDGLGEYAFSINMLNKKTGNLKHLTSSINNWIIEELNVWIDFHQKLPISFESYDVVMGLSGILSFLIDVEEEEGNSKIKEKIITKALKYLVWLTEDYIYKDYLLPRFHIQLNQQFLDIEKRNMLNGHINLGMAHGIIGILLVLLKAKENDYVVTGQEEAIEKIFSIYKKFETHIHGILRYPRRLSIESFSQGIPSDISVNSGWCYGNLGIVRGLMMASKLMGNREQYEYFQCELLKIINQPLQDYNLSSSILCHGYSSVVSVQISSYRESKNKQFLQMLRRNIKKTLEIMHREFENPQIPEKGCSILEGRVGVILSLLEAINPNSNMNYNKLLFIE